MFSFKLLIAAAALVCVSARHIVFEDETGYYLLPIEDLEDLELVPARAGRMRRQVQGSATVKSDGTSGANVKIPIVGNDRNVLSAVAGVGLTDQLKIGETSYGLALNNVEGHGATLTKSHFPGADRVTAAGNVNLYNSGDHKVDVNAFAARTMPEAPHQDSFNTFGTGAEYMYKQKLGAETDYSAAGKLNLFKDSDSSWDFKAGVSKSVSPFIPKSSWEPNYGFSFTKWF
ncbi:Attacin-3 [Operophtera brumata]|uniref:Attacin-3 n=1 Tax=Operophtera brumata TaxID=104452 RepID=A0A0L7LN30_OPEBR|nr:Attacin-3 [Operophtera brumata]